MSLLAKFSLANRGLVALVSIVVAAFGFYAVPSLKQQLLPSLEFPAAFIAAQYPGASPEIVEERVTRPLESSVQGVAGLSKITSTSSEGSATIQAEFEFGTDLGDAVNQMQTAINRLGAQLPEGVDPMVFAGSTEDLPAIVLAAAPGVAPAAEAPVTPGASPSPGATPSPSPSASPAPAGETPAAPPAGGLTADAERAFVTQLEQLVVARLQGIDGVRQAEVTGARKPVIVIAPDPAKLAAARIGPTAIPSALRANGVAVPAGALDVAEQTLPIQVGAPVSTVEELRDVPLLGPAGATPVRLGDVATVEERLAPPTTITRTNGQPSIGVSVTASPEGNAVEISQQVRDLLPELTAGLGAGAALTVVFDQAPFVERSVSGLTTEGLLGLVMAVLVILVFLLSIRSTVVTAVSIPLSVLVALLALWLGDQSLNLLTLGALTIAVGRVVDDSIVVLENIKRHLGYGEDRRRAILDGVREVAGAVTASTLTTVAVFAPIALVGGFVGELFAPFAYTVTVALLASLLVSLTVIPVLAYWFLQPSEEGGDETTVRRIAEERERRNPLQRRYLSVINFATTRRWTTVLIGIAVLLVTFGLASRLETNFIDQSGQDTLSIRQELPVGSGLARTDAAARQVEAVLAETDGIRDYQVTIGSGGVFGFGGANTTASYSVSLAEDAEAGTVEAAVRERLAGLTSVGEITVGGAGGGPGFSPDQLQVIVQAADPEVLAAAAEQVRQAMLATPDVADVTTSLAASAPRLEVRVDRAEAARNGLTEAAVGQAVAQLFRGSPLGQVTVGGEQRDVLLQGGAAPTDIDALRALPLPRPTGGTVPLDTVADVNQVNGPVEVTRIDGNRSITVTGKATGQNIGATSAALTERLDGLTLPPGATYTLGGVSADQAEAFAQLGLAMLAAIAIVFMIMAATFRSLLQPLILLVSVPFAATGAVLLLLLTGTPLGVPALIGMLMLVGIVVTNAIVLLDLINQYRSDGRPVREAVIEGGRRRLRPILMTAIATVFALLPMALGFTGDGGFIAQPLAIVVIGGLISSTALTLVLVPTIYTMVEEAKERFADRRAGGGDSAAGTGGIAARWRKVERMLGAYRPEPGAARPGPVPLVPGPSTPAGEREEAPGTVGHRPDPVAALREKSDQFEILRRPNGRSSGPME